MNLFLILASYRSEMCNTMRLNSSCFAYCLNQKPRYVLHPLELVEDSSYTSPVHVGELSPSAVPSSHKKKCDTVSSLWFLKLYWICLCNWLCSPQRLQLHMQWSSSCSHGMYVVTIVTISEPHFECVWDSYCSAGWSHQDNNKMVYILYELKYVKHLGQCLAHSKYSPCYLLVNATHYFSLFADI